MTDSELVFELLALALVELRDRGRENGDKTVFHIADILHNAPIGLMRAGIDPALGSKVLSSIRERAEKNGCGKWFEVRVYEINRARGASAELQTEVEPQ
jgi:hypothetical protein